MSVMNNIANSIKMAPSRASVLVFTLFVTFVSANGQTSRFPLSDGIWAYDFQVFFPVNVSTLEKDYLENAKTFALLDSVLAVHGTAAVDSVKLVAKSSPEGSYELNITLAQERAESMRAYLVENHPSLNGKIVTEASVARWPVGNKGLSRLRYAAFRLVFPYDVTIPVLPIDITVDESCYLPIVVDDEPFTFNEEPIYVNIPVVSAPARPETRIPVTVAALKTNLLYDALTVYNVELEFPIADRFSIAVENVFPWWEYSFFWCLQMWEMGVEARYWFSSWEPRSADKLRGFFAGAYGMSSKYDFQWLSDVNYQGEYWSAGITGGYSLPVGKRCRMEFSLGLGFLHSDWRHYFPTDVHDKLIRDIQNTGTVSYWGPTKAKVSLVVPINVKVAKKEVRYE